MAYDGSVIIRDQNNNPIPQKWDDENQEWKAYGEMPTKVKQSGSIVDYLTFDFDYIPANDYSTVLISDFPDPGYTNIQESSKKISGKYTHFSVSLRTTGEEGLYVEYAPYGGGVYDSLEGREEILDLRNTDRGVSGLIELKSRGLQIRIYNSTDSDISLRLGELTFH